jgi:hypothetical protein
MTGNTKGKQNGVSSLGWFPKLEFGNQESANPNCLPRIDPLFAFRIKRVVDNKLTRENFVVR